MGISYNAKVPRQGMRLWLDSGRGFGNFVGPVPETASLTSNADNASTSIFSAVLSPDGESLFRINLSGTGTLYRRTLITPFDLSSSGATSSTTANNMDFLVHANNTYLTATDAFRRIYQYDWSSSPKNLSSLSYSNPHYSYSNTPGEVYGTGYFSGFSQGGTVFIGTSNWSGIVQITEFLLSTPYDLNTATVNKRIERSVPDGIRDALNAKYGKSLSWGSKTSVIKINDSSYIYTFFDSTADNYCIFLGKNLYDTDAMLIKEINPGSPVTSMQTAVHTEDDSGNYRIAIVGNNDTDIITINTRLQMFNPITGRNFIASSDRVSIDSDKHLDFNGAGTRVAYLYGDPEIHPMAPGSRATWSWWQYAVDAGNQDHVNIGWETTGAWVGTNGFVFGTGYSTDGPRWGINGTGINYTQMTSTNYAFNVWQNWTVTYSAGTVKTYLNGVLKHTGSAPSTLGSNTNPIYIGATQSRGGNWNGKMDIVQMWDRALDVDEVEGLFETYRGRFGL